MRILLLFLLGIMGWPLLGQNLNCDWFDLENNQAICGTITVPENHTSQTGSLAITYVVLKTTNPNPQHPMIFFSGGPGGASLQAGALQGWAQSGFLEDRDVILFDQRGINRSSPLPNMEQAVFEVMGEDLNSVQEQEAIAKVIADFKNKAANENRNLGHFNSFQNAHDVGSLMKHLGYERYNLFGGSYGTRLARLVQDYYPDLIHSVVLNSPSPMGDDFLVSRIKSYQLALSRIFDYWGEQHPDLKDRYLAVLDKLKGEPMVMEVQGKPFFINAQDAIYLLRRALYGNNSREMTPKLIKAFEEGDQGPIQQVIAMELQLMGGYNSTMWIAVERYEMFDPQYTDSKLDELYQQMELLPERLGIFHSLYREGHNFHDQEWPLAQRKFKSSDVPTIIFVNRYDPVTPPINGKIMQRDLTNGQLFILDEGGHGGGNMQCRLKVMTEFMNAPNADLDTSCLNLFQE